MVGEGQVKKKGDNNGVMSFEERKIYKKNQYIAYTQFTFFLYCLGGKFYKKIDALMWGKEGRKEGIEDLWYFDRSDHVLWVFFTE